MKFSVSVYAEGNRVISLEEIVQLADAVAHLSGIASGAGSMSYGAQIVVDAENSDQAVEIAMAKFIESAEQANLPNWPITTAETISEIDDLEELVE
ncbi:MAG: hypothetical protein Q8L08_01125 [Candidatus Nanopelagicaceae bacterium]|nr:hypothetical protein [Candidatus Nanopelagicaceae bacterium]